MYCPKCQREIKEDKCQCIDETPVQFERITFKAKSSSNYEDEMGAVELGKPIIFNPTRFGITYTSKSGQKYWMSCT